MFMICYVSYVEIIYSMHSFIQLANIPIKSTCLAASQPREWMVKRHAMNLKSGLRIIQNLFIVSAKHT